MWNIPQINKEKPNRYRILTDLSPQTGNGMHPHNWKETIAKNRSMPV
jgi:hypothetical protein